MMEQLKLPDLMGLVNTPNKRINEYANRSIVTNLGKNISDESVTPKIRAAMLARFKDNYDFTKDNNKGFILLASHGYADIVKELLKKEGINPTANNCAALFGAAANGQLETVKALINDPRISPPLTPDANHVAIAEALKQALASKSNTKAQVIALLWEDRRGMNPGNPQTVLSVLETFIEAAKTACSRGDVETAKVLLQKPQASFLLDEYFRLACPTGQKVITNLIIQLIKQKHNQSELQKLLVIAGSEGTPVVLRDLLNDKSILLDGNSEVLWRSATRNKFENTKMLLEDDRVDKVPSTTINTFFTSVIRNGSPQDLDYFLSSKKIFMDVEDLRSFLNQAVDYNKKEHVEVFIKHILKDDFKIINSTDKRNKFSVLESAFRKASALGRLDMVKMLIDIPEINPSAIDNYAIQEAYDQEKDDVVAFLLSHPRITLTDEEVVRYVGTKGKTV
jgi:hypothetical protein